MTSYKGFTFEFCLGLALTWTSTLFTSLGNVLFKVHEEKMQAKMRERDEDDVSDIDESPGICTFHYLAVFLVITGSFFDFASMGLLPMSINCVHSALPIAFGEFWSGCLLPHNKLNLYQWLCIVAILSSVVMVVLCGDHDTSEDPVHIWERNTTKAPSIIFTSSVVAILGVSGMYIKLHKPLGFEVKPLSLYNIAGPIYTSANAIITQISAKLLMTIIVCYMKSCDTDYASAYYCLLFIVPASAIAQLKALAFSMGNLNIVTVIPLYGCCLILFPVFSGVILFEERPSYLPGFIASVCCIFFFNYLFFRVTHHKNSRRLTMQTFASSDYNGQITGMNKALITSDYGGSQDLAYTIEKSDSMVSFEA